MINAIGTESIIEINSFQYSLSDWSRTMQNMAEHLNIRYNSLIYDNSHNVSDLTIGDLQNKAIENRAKADQYQTGRFSVDTKDLARRLEKLLDIG